MTPEAMAVVENTSPTPSVSRSAPAMDQTLINRIVEAALLAANQPLTLAQLQALFPDDAPAPNGSIEAALATLREDCATRGVELVELASGFRYQVQADVHAWVARLWTERQTRYTRATLETLALIAYRQPITRGEIEQVRGVAVNSNIIKALEEREWIRVVGHRDVPGKPALFGTTKTFLDYFGLKRLDELPPLSELRDIGELEPQLQFDSVPGSGGRSIEAGGIEAGAPDGADAAADGAVPVDMHPDLDRDAPASADERDAPSDTEFHDTPGAATASPDATSPEAAPGERAADENDHERGEAVDTTMPGSEHDSSETQAQSETDTPEPLQ